MPDPVYKTKEDSIKLKVSEEAAQPDETTSLSPGSKNESTFTSENSPNSQSNETQQTQHQNINDADNQKISSHQAAPLTAADPDDLLDVIENPHAPENEWIKACNELEKHNNRQKRKAQNQDSSGKRKKAIIASAILSVFVLGGGFMAASYNHWTPFWAKQEQKQEVDFGPYMKSLQQEIKSHWHPPKGHEHCIITLHFKVSKSGEISNVGFDRLSRLPEADAATLKAIIESMPSAPPLPEGAPDSVDIQFTFDYNVYNHKPYTDKDSANDESSKKDAPEQDAKKPESSTK